MPADRPKPLEGFSNEKLGEPHTQALTDPTLSWIPKAQVLNALLKEVDGWVPALFWEETSTVRLWQELQEMEKDTRLSLYQRLPVVSALKSLIAHRELTPEEERYLNLYRDMVKHNRPGLMRMGKSVPLSTEEEVEQDKASLVPPTPKEKIPEHLKAIDREIQRKELVAEYEELRRSNRGHYPYSLEALKLEAILFKMLKDEPITDQELTTLTIYRQERDLAKTLKTAGNKLPPV